MSQNRYCPPTTCKICKQSNVPANVIYETELFVESGSILNRKWKRVWCRFDGEHMVYYEAAISSTDVNTGAPRKFVDCLHVAGKPHAEAKNHQDHPPPHAPFIVTTSNKTVTFVALSADDRTTWIKQILGGAQNSHRATEEQCVALPIASTFKTPSSTPAAISAPQTADEFKDEYSRHSHFHADFRDRKDAEAHLGSRQPGSFVLRPSSQAGCISLSFCKPTEGAIGHSLLRMHADTASGDTKRIGWSVDDKNTYSTLDALLMTLEVDLNSKP